MMSQIFNTDGEAAADCRQKQVDFNSPFTVSAVVLLTCAGASMFMVQPLFLGAMADSMGLDGGQIGLLAGIELAGGALGSVAAVLWVRRINWRAVAYFSLGMIVVGNLLSAMAGSLDYLIAIRFFTGFLGQGTTYAVALAVISGIRNPDRVFAFTIAAQVGLAMIALFFFPGLIEEHGASGLLIPLAVFGLCIIPLVTKLPVGSPEHDELQATSTTESGMPAIIGLGVQVLWYLGIGAVWAFVERIGSASGLDGPSIGSALAISMGVGIIGALLASIVGNRWGRLRVYSLALVGMAAGIYMLTTELTWLSFTVALILFNLFWNLGGPFLLGAIAASDRTGRFTVLIIAAQASGLAAGPLIAGYMSQSFGLVSIAYFSMLMCFAAISMFAVMLRTAGLQYKKGSGNMT